MANSQWILPYLPKSRGRGEKAASLGRTNSSSHTAAIAGTRHDRAKLCNVIVTLCVDICWGASNLRRSSHTHEAGDAPEGHTSHGGARHHPRASSSTPHTLLDPSSRSASVRTLLLNLIVFRSPNTSLWRKISSKDSRRSLTPFLHLHPSTSISRLRTLRALHRSKTKSHMPPLAKGLRHLLRPRYLTYHQNYAILSLRNRQ